MSHLFGSDPRVLERKGIGNCWLHFQLFCWKLVLNVVHVILLCFYYFLSNTAWSFNWRNECPWPKDILKLVSLFWRKSFKCIWLYFSTLGSIRDALCLIWLILARWLLNWLIFLPSVHFHYVTYYYLPSKQSTILKKQTWICFFLRCFVSGFVVEIFSVVLYKKSMYFRHDPIISPCNRRGPMFEQTRKKVFFIRWILVRCLGEIEGGFLEKKM